MNTGDIYKTKLRNFTVFYRNKRELHVLKREIFQEQIYDMHLKDEPKTILDIGAHIGLSTIYFKEKYPNAYCFAFEPNPLNYELLEMNVFNNGFENVKCFNTAISSKSGKKQLYFNKENMSSSSFRQNAWDGSEKNQESFLVDCITLNDFVNEKVDLIKMDIEGLEEEVILNSKKALKLTSNLIFEFHYSKKNSFDRIEKFLRSCSFDFEEISKPQLNSLYIFKCFRKNE